MRLRNRILSVLNANNDFFSLFARQFDESKKSSEHAFSLAIGSILYAINVQCILNERTEEICRIAKECSLINFATEDILCNEAIIVKGKGANSEIFGDRFNNIVDITSHRAGLKSRSANKLFVLLTPLILSHIYFIYKANNYTHDQLASFLARQNRYHALNNNAKYELNLMIKDETTKHVVEQQQPRKTGIFYRLMNTGWWHRFMLNVKP